MVGSDLTRIAVNATTKTHYFNVKSGGGAFNGGATGTLFICGYIQDDDDNKHQHQPVTMKQPKISTKQIEEVLKEFEMLKK